MVIPRLNGGVELEASYANKMRANNATGYWGYQLTVRDPEVSKSVDGFDGLEKPYLMVPVAEKNGVAQRERVNLGWAGWLSDAGKRDVYQEEGTNWSPNVTEDPSLVKKHGIEIYLDTNRGTFQAPTVYDFKNLDKQS